MIRSALNPEEYLAATEGERTPAASRYTEEDIQALRAWIDLACPKSICRSLQGQEDLDTWDTEMMAGGVRNTESNDLQAQMVSIVSALQLLFSLVHVLS